MDLSKPAVIPGNLDVEWIHGSVSPKHNTDPDIQVHWYDPHTVILRQNKAVHYEAPFLFLMFGNDRCILLDTGATKSPAYFPLRATIDSLIEEWLNKNGDRIGKSASSSGDIDNKYTLVVAHTHLHRDHYEGDAQFEGRPNTVMVGKTLAETQAFYGFQSWPDDMDITFDLGKRPLAVLATPGHEDAEVTIYDPYSMLLFTGDLVLPGRLYVRDWSAFRESIARLITFCDSHPISHILGCHIEMSKYPGTDYLIRTTYQPHERPLQMSTDHLRVIETAIQEIDGRPGQYFYDDFVIYNGVPDRYFAYENMDDEAEAGDVCQACRLEREKK